MIDDPFLRGSEYLSAMRQLALQPEMIDLTDDINDRIRICRWIGKNIDRVNAELNACLEACHQCFAEVERREMQILATPLASHFAIDGLCNILVEPVAILIDVGRIAAGDWLSVVVHEYAHAHLKSPGHDRRFLRVLTHLCLGLGLEPPVWEAAMDTGAIATRLCTWPHCGSTPDPLAFWMGSSS